MAATRAKHGLRGLLVAVGILVGWTLFLATIALLERAKVLRDLSPPPHFQMLRSAQGGLLRDGRGRELWSVNASAAALVGREDVDRLSLAKEKDSGVFRILSIGESTTFGAGYQNRASYSRYLEARLRRRLGRESVEVVNCGKSGYDSHDWPTLADELAAFAPDLLVIYVGHNELKKPNLLGVVEPAKAMLRASKTLRRLFGEPKDDLPDPPSLHKSEGVDGGPYLTPEQRERAVAGFERGLRALLDAARRARIPVVVCIPASNVLDHPPRLSRLSVGRTDLEEVALAGKEFERGEIPPSPPASSDAAFEEASSRLDRVLAAEPEAAILHFRRARLLLQLGRDEAARAAFARALELDGLPERASPDLVRSTRRIAAEQGAVVADVEKRFEREAKRGVPGFDLFFDYCHPLLWGHWLIADELLAVIEHSGLLAPPSEFVATREPGGSPRECFEAWNRELHVSEADAAQFSIDRSRLEAARLGTLPDASPADWKNVEEFLEAATKQDPSLVESSADLHVLQAFAAAGQGRLESARAHVEKALAIDAAATQQLARKAAPLAGLVAIMARVGIELGAEGFELERNP